MREITKQLEDAINDSIMSSKTTNPFVSTWLTEKTTCWSGGRDKLVRYARELFFTITERVNSRTGLIEYELTDKEGYGGLIQEPEKSPEKDIVGENNWLMIVVH